jgi:hypothetical protein
MRTAGFVWALGCLVCGLAAPAYGADADRGRVLYEIRCNVCHDKSVHARHARKASSFDAIREQVVRWNTELGGAWSVEEINDVTLYLNDRYYFFRCPESVCVGGQAWRGSGSFARR